MTNPSFPRAGNRFGRGRGPVPVATEPATQPPSPDPGDAAGPFADTVDPDQKQHDQNTPVDPGPAEPSADPIDTTESTQYDEQSAPKNPSAVDPEPAVPSTDSHTSTAGPDPEVRKPTTKRGQKAVTRPRKETDTEVVPLVVIHNGAVVVDGPVHVLDLDKATDLEDVDLLELVRGLRAVADSDLKVSSVKALMKMIEEKVLTGA